MQRRNEMTIASRLRFRSEGCELVGRSGALMVAFDDVVTVAMVCRINFP